jgi:hypothetical protein
MARVFNGQREEVLPFAHLSGRNHGTQDLGFTISKDDSAVRLTGHFARFHNQRLSVEIDFNFLISHLFLFLTGLPVTYNLRLPKMAEEDGLRQPLIYW